MEDNRYKYMYFKNKCIFFIKFLNISDSFKTEIFKNIFHQLEIN